MTIMSLSLCTLPRDGNMLFASFAQSVDLLHSRIIAPESADKLNRFICYRSDCFSSTMVVDFGHCRFIDALYAAIEAVIGCLVCHLNKGIRGEAHRSHKILAVCHEF